ncbi:MAG TPA: IS1182 family transposase [Kofleriaceae bacterium]|nr:IS1182 family transposase [Kofleriaceae bacterium]
MSRSFKPYVPEQTLLLPPSLRDWLPEDHLALFLSDVVDTLDLSAIVASYEQGDGRGQPPYDPGMMVKLLVYGYCTGRPSSRRIERATYDDVAFRVLAGNQHPDHDSVASFRKRHLDALSGLFGQVLRLCRAAGMVKLGHIAIDGTKIKANASKHKAMSYARMADEQAALEKQITELLAEAQRIDDAEDGEHGRGKRGDELPEELRRREARLARIQQAKQALETEAKARAELERVEIERRRAEREQRPPKQRGREIKDPKEEPAAKAQRNFTDPESRIMLDGATKGFVQGYNVQAAVDEAHQIIVATYVTQAAQDMEQLVPMLAAIEQNVGELPKTVSADAGYFSQSAVGDARAQRVDLHVPPRRMRRDAKVAATNNRENDAAARMRAKLDRPEGRAIYARRKTIVEPVFGQVKEARRFRRFSLRGHRNVQREWLLVAATHNLMKLFVARRSRAAAA